MKQHFKSVIITSVTSRSRLDLVWMCWRDIPPLSHKLKWQSNMKVCIFSKFLQLRLRSIQDQFVIIVFISHELWRWHFIRCRHLFVSVNFSLFHPIFIKLGIYMYDNRANALQNCVWIRNLTPSGLGSGK